MVSEFFIRVRPTGQSLALPQCQPTARGGSAVEDLLDCRVRFGCFRLDVGATRDGGDPVGKDVAGLDGCPVLAGRDEAAVERSLGLGDSTLAAADITEERLQRRDRAL